MRSSSRTLGLATLLTVLTAPLYANPAAPKAAAPAAQPAQASASEAKPASAGPAAQAAAAPSQAAQPAAEGVSVANAPSAAAGKNTCEDVKAGIEAKIKARGVKAFTLDIVAKDDAKDAKVVGNCEGGKKLITYKRG